MLKYTELRNIPHPLKKACMFTLDKMIKWKRDQVCYSNRISGCVCSFIILITIKRYWGQFSPKTAKWPPTPFNLTQKSTQLIIFIEIKSYKQESQWIVRVYLLENCKSFWSSRPEVLFKKGVLKIFAKFTGKHLCHSLIFNNVTGLNLQLD